MKVYAFEICSCKYESGFSIHSIYINKTAAYKAMLKHRFDIIQENIDDRLTYFLGKKEWDWKSFVDCPDSEDASAIAVREKDNYRDYKTYCKIKYDLDRIQEYEVIE
jgi:hypothetical protein